MEDIRLIIGDKGKEFEIPAYLESPTWIVDRAWEKVEDIVHKCLAAYLEFCRTRKYDHSFLLGLDILITGVADSAQGKIVDIRPTILEGPCCNSYPACPNLWSYRLHRNLQEKGLDPDSYVEYPTHPSKILDSIVETFLDTWKFEGNTGLPVVAVFTRPYEESEEETAHIQTLAAFERAGVKVFRVTPAESPGVKDGKLIVDGVPIDMVYRRIERIHVPIFYGEEIGTKIIEEATKTMWINPWKVDDLRSKTIEEKCFREWEEKTGETISRPRTLLENEISSKSVGELAENSGYALKRWNSTGGKGVFLHISKEAVGPVVDALYQRYDGRHMFVMDAETLETELAAFDDFKEDTAIQQLRLIDSREIKEGRLVYDTRINVLYNPLKDRWQVLSGISRSVPCGPSLEKGNSLLTNISAGAEIAPLILGKSKKDADLDDLVFGPLAEALMAGETETKVV